MSNDDADRPNFVLKPHNRGFKTEDLLADLRRVAADLGGRPPTYEEYETLGRFSAEAPRRRLGPWAAALEAAGLPVLHKRREFTDEDLFSNLASVWTALGRQPRRPEMCKPLSLFGSTTYERRFGGWRSALEAFVGFMNGAPLAESRDAPKKEIERVRGPRFPSLRLRWRVLSRDAFRCTACGRSPATHQGLALHVDHVVPWSRGGETSLENLATKCADCNLGKSDEQSEPEKERGSPP